MSSECTSRSPVESVKEVSFITVWRKFLDCFFLLRIALLVPVWTIFLLGFITGNHSAGIGGQFAGAAALSGMSWFALFGFSLIVASIYVVNQIVDIESDRINRKLFLLPHGFISVRTAWILAVFCAAAGLGIAVFVLGSMPITFIFIISLLLGMLYNLPPFQLKNSALGGISANAIGHGLLTFLAGWFSAHASQPFSMPVLYAGLLSGIAPTLANAAVYLATTIPDAVGDRTTGKKTFCVAFGDKKTAVTSALFCAGTLGSSFLMANHFWVMAVPSAISLFIFVLFAASTTRNRSFQAFKWPVFLLSAFVALFVPEYAALILITLVGSKAYYKWRFNIDYPTLKMK
ncbi:MAG: UbiA family prenyltransferase [Chitinispirillaceae bacterium]|nr:UbiA family prenyltransferase [Chitinispirillaceae bacterium]